MVLKASELLNIILSALVAGVFWGPWVGLTRSVATFEPQAFLAIGYRLGVNLAPLMSVLMPLALVSAVPTLIVSAGTRPTTFVLTLAGVALFVVALVVTVAIEVPIAARIKSWSMSASESAVESAASVLPEDWRRQRDRWASVHIIRVVAGLAGLVLLVAAAIYG